MEGDWQMLAWARQAGCPAHVLLTKADKLSRGKAASVLQTAGKALGAEATIQLFSALKGSGVEEARAALDRLFGSVG
jgi:GTP-binding protein